MAWRLGDEGVRGTALDERGLRQWHSRFDWWDQLHHLYVLLALVGTIAGFALGATAKEKILLVFVGGYVVVVAVFAALSAFVNGEKARYAPIMSHMHSAMHSLRNLRVLMQARQFDDGPEARELLIKELSRVLDSLRSSFELASGTAIECRIEVVQRPRGSTDLQQLSTYALVRDSASASRRLHMDDDGRRNPHPVVKSTAHMSLLHGDSPACYFCGDIAAQQDFASEYFARFPHDPRPRSTIVWPIRYRRRQTPGSSAEERSQEIVGFLHVESNSRGAFNRRYDIEMGAAFADSMFDVLFGHAKARKDVVHAILAS
jgi:hypothetical protein